MTSKNCNALPRHLLLEARYFFAERLLISPITYTVALEGITANSLRSGFFEGWPNPPTPETHLRILKGSAAVVLALDGEKVVGFITALSDGVVAAYIPLLEVLPAYRHQGIGAELVRRMISQLQAIYMIDLLCDSTLVPFYEQFGMQQVSGMVLRNFTTQAGLASAFGE